MTMFQSAAALVLYLCGMSSVAVARQVSWWWDGQTGSSPADLIAFAFVNSTYILMCSEIDFHPTISIRLTNDHYFTHRSNHTTIVSSVFLNCGPGVGSNGSIVGEVYEIILLLCLDYINTQTNSYLEWSLAL